MQLRNLILCFVAPACVFAISKPKISQSTKNLKIKEVIQKESWNVTNNVRVMGGSSVSVDVYPWMALIWASLPGTVAPLTNAVVISRYFAMTTNHAMYSINSGVLGYVLIAHFEPDHIQSQQIRQVKQIIPHVDFSGTNLFDIVLVRICPGIAPKYYAPLAQTSSVYYSGDTANIFGYSLALKKATKMVAEWCECERYPDWTMDQHVCLECNANVYTDIGTSDVGMVAAMINGEVAAMVQISNHDCAHMYGEMALNIAKFRDWIDANGVYDDTM